MAANLVCCLVNYSTSSANVPKKEASGFRTKPWSMIVPILSVENDPVATPGQPTLIATASHGRPSSTGCKLSAEPQVAGEKVEEHAGQAGTIDSGASPNQATNPSLRVYLLSSPPIHLYPLCSHSLEQMLPNIHMLPFPFEKGTYSFRKTATAI